MKNVSSLKSNKIETPKTPGGISKSLLTPCRRVGLSRNWRKGGPSPFVSPLSGAAEVTREPDIRKRKERDVEDTNTAEENVSKSNEIGTTPSRHLDVPRRKKSKTTALIKEQMNEENENIVNESEDNDIEHQNEIENEITQVVTPIYSKTKSKTLISPLYTSINNIVDLTPSECNVVKLKEKKKSIKKEAKKKSPENLTKECIVVIQKKIFKKALKNKDESNKNETAIINEQKPINSQTLFDSDSDELPLSKLNKNATKDDKAEQPKIVDLDDDDDFTENNIKIKRLEDKTTSTGSLKKLTVKKKNKAPTIQKPVEPINEYKQSSQSSVDDDDDFNFDKKKTILIRKSYDKVTRPLKAKSTGSITEKDIDELRSRIEVKKKLLLAKATTEDTQELRDLIKKWQKGCQDALMELMELMRSKFPDKQNMEYSEMLQMLKIPSVLVGYDADNDCFSTPDDAGIILSKFSDI